MKKKSIHKIFMAFLCFISAYTYAWDKASNMHRLESGGIPFSFIKTTNLVTPYVYDLDPLIVIQQNVNQKGLVVMQGKLTKPFTSDHVKLLVKYQDSQGGWVTAWCKTLYSYNQYNETLIVRFELPASAMSSYNVKVELSSDTNLSNFNSVVWDKSVSHYKFNDYVAASCDLDENEYTMLLTPKKEGTLLTNSTGKVLGVKDRVTSTHFWNKLSNVLMNNKKDDVVFSTTKPSDLITDANGNKAVKLVNTGAVSDTLAATPEFIYNETAGHPIPYLYSYDDPVYMFAGKFSANGFFIKFSQWPQEANGPGYFNWKSPTFIESRYFNMYNKTWKNLSEFIPDQQPVVIVSSITTGLRAYKSDGTYVDLTPNSTSNYGAPYFGYTNGQGVRRGPGSENLIISNTSEMSLYGVGALRNDISTSYQSKRSMQDIEKEIFKFIKYTGVFGSTTAYDGASECSQGCFTLDQGAVSDYNIADWSKAPNSYIFDPSKTNDGLYIPVKKAYKIWESDIRIGGVKIPEGTVTADVLWEDIHGLIKTGANYSLEIIGSGENARIKVPINKSKEGNAVIAYKVNGEVYWSWHVWITDDPTNGSTYKSITDVQRQLTDGTIENIPDAEWGWMDRNLGAVNTSLTGEKWNRGNGLLYQWGRKDPFPPLVTKGNDFYEVTGSINKRVRHRGAQETNQSLGTSIDNLKMFVKVQDANVKNNIQMSVKNPLSLIYIMNNTDTKQAFYNKNQNLPYNWFGTYSSLTADKLGELNLWSDNSLGKVTGVNYNSNTQKKPYRNKSVYDPCPNGWRVPSMLVANLGNSNYLDDVRVDYSPFGINPNGGITNNIMPNTILPSNANMPSYMQNFKIYPLLGFDMKNVSGNNLGIFPGTGKFYRDESLYGHYSQYTDQHETYLWTSTMARWADTSPAVSARGLRLVPDASQYVNNYRPDATNFPDVWGRYEYYPLNLSQTSDALGCRCIKDPLFIKNGYNFPTEFYKEPIQTYEEGLYNPNSYMLVKDTNVQTVEIPVSKAFSAQSQLLDNSDILNSNSFNSLKANVLWTTNPNLVQNITVTGNPSSLADINNTKIIVKIAPNESGNAIVTLHNGNITNPVYWSWHVWVTGSQVTAIAPYTTEEPNSSATNYVNYVKKEVMLQTEFMDRNLGAEEAFPTVLSPKSPTSVELAKIKLSGGLQYQWGRKDPIPPFINPDKSTYSIYLGNADDNGNISYSILNDNTYNNPTGNYIVPYNTYTNSSNANLLSTDKISTKVSKVLSYSVRNPLIFMVPSNFAPVFSSLPAYTNGSDWLSNESNIGADRWGRADRKSPFDPCPDGWRIPDVVSASTGTQFNNFPWAKKDVSDTGIMSIISVYLGTRVGDGLGYQFNNAAYKIGNYPFVGIRGFRDVIHGGTPSYTSLHSAYTGIWTASLSSNYYGRAANLLIDKYNENMVVHNDNSDPYFGMNCRCVKIKYQGSEQQGAMPAISVANVAAGKASDILAKAAIIEKVINNQIELFPNPVKTVLYIKGNDSAKNYYYQIYNMSGQLVMSGQFENEQAGLSSLITGMYLIRINNSEKVVKIIKE